MTRSRDVAGSPTRSGVATALAAGAGAVGLAWEVLWARLLTVEIGGALTAFTIAVGAFTAGLAAGAALFGHLAETARRPLAILGWCQAGIAALGALSALAGTPARPLLVAAGWSPDGTAFALGQALAGGAPAFIAATLMGGTLPLLMRAAAPRGAEAARVCGRLAAANAAGAASGALATGFLLLPFLGTRASMGAAAVAGAAVALVAARLRSGERAAVPPAATADGGGFSRVGSARWAILGILLTSGASLTALEVVWTRLATLAFGSSSQAAALVLAVVIGAIAAGNAIGGRIAARTANPWRPLASLGALAGLAILATDPLLARLPLVAFRLTGWLLPEGPSSWEIASGEATRLAILVCVTSVPSLLVGALLPVAFAALTVPPHGRREETAGIAAAAGAVVAASAVGNLLGAPIALMALSAGAGSRGTLMGAAALLSAAGLMAARDRCRGALALVALGSVPALALATRWDPALMSSGPYIYGALYRGASARAPLSELLAARGDLVFEREGPQALVTVRRRPDGALSMQVNGKTDASTSGDMTTQTLISALPLLLHASSGRPATSPRVLIVGLGSGVTAGAALAHPIADARIVEISPEVVAAAALFEQANGYALRDPRARLTVGDVRTLLAYETGPESEEGYDIIASQPSNPWVSGQAILFTREFFMLARARLAPGGLMSQWLQGQGLGALEFRSIVATFAGVFPHVSLWEESTGGGDYILIGSEDPLRIDAAVMRGLMREPSVSRSLARVEIREPADLLARHVSGEESLRAFSEGAPSQTEDRLALETSAMRALHRETLGEILAALEPHRTPPVLASGTTVDLLVDLTRRAREARREREWATGLGLLEPEGGGGFEMIEAISRLRAGLRADALEAVTEAVLRRPSDRLPRVVLAHLMMSAGRVEEAATQLEAATAIAPDDARLRLFLARALFAAGRRSEALASNAESRRLDPRLAEAASDRCAMLLAAEDMASAEAACLEALSDDPGLAEAHANLGLLQARRGRLEEAERSYRAALVLDRDLADARYNLAALLERGDRAAEGAEVIRPLVTESALPDAQALRLAARLALLSGDAGSARVYLERSLALEPDDRESADLRKRLR